MAKHRESKHSESLWSRCFPGLIAAAIPLVLSAAIISVCKAYESINHNSLPAEIRPYDVNQNGVLEPSETNQYLKNR